MTCPFIYFFLHPSSGLLLLLLLLTIIILIIPYHHHPVFSTPFFVFGAALPYSSPITLTLKCGYYYRTDNEKGNESKKTQLQQEPL